MRGGTGRTSSAASASAATATVSGVGDNKAVVVPILLDGGAVAADRIFGDRVGDGLSIGLNLQSVKASGPAVILAQFQRSARVLSVRNQPDRDACGLRSGGCVPPDLPDMDLRLFRPAVREGSATIRIIHLRGDGSVTLVGDIRHGDLHDCGVIDHIVLLIRSVRILYRSVRDILGDVVGVGLADVIQGVGKIVLVRKGDLRSLSGIRRCVASRRHDNSGIRVALTDREGEIASVQASALHLLFRLEGDGSLCIVGVGNCQALASFVIHGSGQLVGGIVRLRDGDSDLVRLGIIGDTLRAAVLLGDRVLVGSCLLELDLSEDCGLLRIRCGGRQVLRHRCAVGHRCKLEFEDILLAPVVVFLGDLQVLLYGGEGVGDGQAVIIIILDSCGQLVRRIIRLRDCDGDIVLCRIVAHAVDSVIHFGDGVLVGSCLHILDLAKLCGLFRVRSRCFHCRHICGFLRLFGRTFRLFLFGRHRSSVDRLQFEGKAVRLAPVFELLRNFKLFPD